MDGPRFVDSHVHLGDYPDPRQAVAFGLHAGALLVTAGTGRATSEAGVKLSDAHPACVRAFVGIHPSEAEREDGSGWLDGMIQRGDGVGEVGLDPKYSPIGRGSRQMEVLLKQLEGAERARKPVEVHTRGAEGECLEILGTYRPPTVLLHWFQGEELASRASEQGHFVSFGPALLTSKKLQRIARGWPRDRILTESDGPVGFAALGGAGGPWLVPSVTFKLAELLDITFEEEVSLVARNSLEFLGSKA